MFMGRWLLFLVKLPWEIRQSLQGRVPELRRASFTDVIVLS